MHIEAQNLSLYSTLIVAFVGGFGHCAFMCGGIVLAYSAKLKDSKLSKIKNLFFHLLYHFGRVSTYAFLGGVVGFFGSMFSLNAFLHAGLLFCVGVAMILAGLSLFGKSRFLLFLEGSLQNFAWYQKAFRQIFGLKNPLSLYLLGALNGLLPCGFVYAFLLGAATLNALDGAVLMAVFGLGTLPSLLLVALFSQSLLSKNFFRKWAMTFVGVAIIIFGILMAYKGVKIAYKGYFTKEIQMQKTQMH